MVVPENGATILTMYLELDSYAAVLGAAIFVHPELDIYAAILGHGDASSEQYVAFASVGNEGGRGSA